MLIRAVAVGFALFTAIAVCDPAFAESDAEETKRYDSEAVARVVNSHDTALILKGAELMVKQQAVRAAHKTLVKWGREENLGPKWWETRPEWIAATIGSSALSPVDKSTSMYATTSAVELDQAVRSARPRPFVVSWTTRTCWSSAASSWAMAGVPSVDALSAMVICQENGNSFDR